MAYLGTRWLALAVGAWLSAAAAPLDAVPLAMMAPLTAGTPTANGPRRFTPAPVPNLDLDGTVPYRSGPASVRLLPSFFHQQDTVKGAGFTPNSSIFGEQMKKLRPAPGLTLSVPLE
jgi:hypothetical protein